MNADVATGTDVLNRVIHLFAREFAAGNVEAALRWARIASELTAGIEGARW